MPEPHQSKTWNWEYWKKGDENSEKGNHKKKENQEKEEGKRRKAEIKFRKKWKSWMKWKKKEKKVITKENTFERLNYIVFITYYS